MSLSTTEIDTLLDEIASNLTGGWIQKVYQPLPRCILLEIRSKGRTLRLFLSADPETARLHLVSQRYPNPDFPPKFCQFLRAHILGSRIDGMERILDDRIIRIRLTNQDGPCSLIGALTGKSADLLVLDSQDLIRTSLNFGEKAKGKSYRPPTEPHHSLPIKTQGPQDFSGNPLPGDLDPSGKHFPLSLAIEHRYQQRDMVLARQRARQARTSQINKRIKQTKRRITALQADREKAGRYQDYARYGELLKSGLDAIAKGQNTVTVTDYFDETLPDLVLPVDPAKSPHANMDDYFKKHRKYLSAEKKIQPRLEKTEQELNALQKERANLDAETDDPMSEWGHVQRLNPTMPTMAQREPRKKAAPARSGPFRKFTSTDGIPIYVGRNARENEELTLKFARSDDLWLHARGTPGSHVVVRLEKGAVPPHETLRDAATLALLYSDLKKSGKGEVIYTQKKVGQKGQGASPRDRDRDTRKIPLRQLG